MDSNYPLLRNGLIKLRTHVEDFLQFYEGEKVRVTALLDHRDSKIASESLSWVLGLEGRLKDVADACTEVERTINMLRK
jgi:hypothetical protein